MTDQAELSWLQLSTDTDGTYRVATATTAPRYTVHPVDIGAVGLSPNGAIPALRVDLPGHPEPPLLVYSPGRRALAKTAAKKFVPVAFAALNWFISRENARKGLFVHHGVVRRYAPERPGSPGQTARSVGMGALLAGSVASYREIWLIVTRPVEGYYDRRTRELVIQGAVRDGDLMPLWMTFGE